MDERPQDPLDPHPAPQPSGAIEGPDAVDLVASAIVDGEPIPPGADPEDPRVLAAVAELREVAARVAATGDAVPPDRSAIRAAIEAAGRPARDAVVVPLAGRRRGLSTRVVGIAAALLIAVGIGGVVLRDAGDSSDRELSTAGSADDSARGADETTSSASAEATSPVPESDVSADASAGDTAAASPPNEASPSPGPQAPPSTIAPVAESATALLDLGQVDSVDDLRTTVRTMVTTADASLYSTVGRRGAEPRCATSVATTGTPVAVARLDGQDVIAVVTADASDIVVLRLDDCTIVTG